LGETNGGYVTRSGKSGINVFCDGVLHKQGQFGVQRNNTPKATIPHTENKPGASNANPSTALFFFEVEVEDAADPLAVPLPDVPLPVLCGVVEEGLTVGAANVPGALTSKSELCASTWVSVVSRNQTR